MERTPLTRISKFFSILFVGLALVFGACEVEEEPEVVEEDIGEVEVADDYDADPSIADLEGDPGEFVGRIVTVDGEVEELYGLDAFTIEGNLFTGDLLVLVPPAVTIASGLAEDTEVQVTGEVIEYIEVELEGMYDWDLDYDLIEYEEREPVLIAQTIVTGEMAAESDY